MKALLQRAYGTPDTLELVEIATPTPGVGEVLVRVRAASINAGDWFIMTGRPYIARLAFGISRPKVTVRGRDVAGTVEAIGAGVTTVAIGDNVFGECATGSREPRHVPARYDRIVGAPGVGPRRRRRVRGGCVCVC